VFYTDGENGRATPRAWLRFTQLFPSLRGADHRWKDETTPLRYNWEGRKPLSESNPHQYAMKIHGTRVWGWEMPWWNYTVGDARRMGRDFACAFLTTIEEIRANTNAPSVSPGGSPSGAGESPAPPIKVARWNMHEFSVKGQAHVANPDRED